MDFLMKLGVHVSIGGRICDAFLRVQYLGCNTMQIFSRSPQRWRQKKQAAQDIEEFIRLKNKSKINPVFIHIPYLANLASPFPRLYQASIKAYLEDIEEADFLKADYIVTHMGSHKNTSEEEGLKRLIKALGIILKKTNKSSIGILLENTSGSGSWLGYNFKHQKLVFDRLGRDSRLGICLDTAHAFAAGYDISTQAGLDQMLSQIDDAAGIGRIKLVHLNDLKAKLGSRRDMHEHIGRGSIGLEGMRRIINHPALKHAAFILETPKDSDNADKMNLNTVKALRKNGRK